MVDTTPKKDIINEILNLLFEKHHFSIDQAIDIINNVNAKLRMTGELRTTSES